MLAGGYCGLFSMATVFHIFLFGNRRNLSLEEQVSDAEIHWQLWAHFPSLLQPEVLMDLQTAR